MYLEALQICRRLVKDNPQTYEPDLAKTLNNLGLLYHNTQRFYESEANYLEALEIRRRLAKDNPQAYESDAVQTLNNLAALYFDTQRLTESETMYLEVLEIYSRLAKDDPEALKSALAQTLNDLGQLKMNQELYNEAISYFNDASALFKEPTNTEISPQQWFEYGKSLYYLSNLYSAINEHRKCYDTYEEFISILRNHFLHQPDYNRNDYVEALGSQSFQCIFVGQLEKAEQYAREALSIDPTQHWINTNLAASLLLQGKYNDAEALYRQYKDELKDSFLDDFNEFEAEGIILKERMADVERIRKMLNE